ncbi:MAG: hypothetical protein QOI20_3087 [Acidimicrobiaceae bacterium]|jgi:hypothetical protein|nr:hypothetical protein [Acidimicrobiaceae bacterium]
MRRVVAAVAAVALMGFGGCTSGGGGKGSAARIGSSPSTVVPAAGVVSAAVPDIPPKELIEPEPKTDRERLLAKAGQIYDFCQDWNIIEGIPEPRPHDADDLVRFGAKYYETLKYLDPTRKVLERVPAPGGGPPQLKAVSLSPQTLTDLVRLRLEAFGYFKRVSVTRIAMRRKEIDAARAQARYDDAFRRLAEDDVQAVYQRLLEYSNGHCHL